MYKISAKKCWRTRPRIEHFNPLKEFYYLRQLTINNKRYWQIESGWILGIPRAQRLTSLLSWDDAQPIDNAYGQFYGFITTLGYHVHQDRIIEAHKIDLEELLLHKNFLARKFGRFLYLKSQLEEQEYRNEVISTMIEHSLKYNLFSEPFAIPQNKRSSRSLFVDDE